MIPIGDFKLRLACSRKARSCGAAYGIRSRPTWGSMLDATTQI
ncbi:MAG: hypothetical protein NT164_01815 [Verrucomicrobiae bacterium]|nr:hypothetical protein [Verrucomicrobiae bacterium]